MAVAAVTKEIAWLGVCCLAVAVVENISSYECDTEQLLGKQLGVASWAVNPRQGDIPPSRKSLPAIAKRLADDARGVLSLATTADVMKSNPTLWSTVSDAGRYLVMSARDY